MKHNLNVIQIRGIRGLIIAGSAVCCLFAGFIVFPGWVWMHIWNFIASNIDNIPAIGIFQGVLLWGILIACYFIFKRDSVVVCFRTPQGLNEEELKSVFEDIKKDAENDPVLKSMLKAREAELKLKGLKLSEKDNINAMLEEKIKEESQAFSSNKNDI